MVTLMRGMVIDSWSWRLTGICADIPCLKVIQEPLHEALPATGRTMRDMNMMDGTESRGESAQGPQEEKDEVAIMTETAIETATNHLIVNEVEVEVEVDLRIMGHLPTALSYLKEFQ